MESLLYIIEAVLMPFHLTLNWMVFIIPFFWVLAAFFWGFLFWRAGKHELMESNFLLDSLLVFIISAVVAGRLFDFVLDFQKNHLSLLQLIFFNHFGGFDYFGAIFGGFVGTWIFLRDKKYKFMEIADLFAAPLIFFRLISSFGHLLNGFFGSGSNAFYFLVRSLVFLVLFFVIKRLEAKKRSRGFFFASYLVIAGLVEASLYFIFGESRRIFGFGYEIFAYGALFFVGLIFWHFSSKHKFSRDMKTLSAVFLLWIFGVKRVLTSVREADKFAKAVIFFPYTLAKWLFSFVKLLIHEFARGLIDFAKAWGVGR